MPVLIKKDLLDSLQKDVEHTLGELSVLIELPPEKLLLQPAAGKWSIAQVLEHLNAYNRFYINVMELAMDNRKVSVVNAFKPGWLGNYFTKMMMTGDDGFPAKKMSAPKDYSFGPDLDAANTLAEFEAGQQKLLLLLQKAQSADLNTRIPISISKLIKLKLGDGFRFLIAHQLRHFMQIKRVHKQVAHSSAA